MPLFNWSAMVVFWHWAQSPPKRAPESWVPGIVSCARAVASPWPAIQSCADSMRRGAATAAGAPMSAVAETAAAPARKLRRSMAPDYGGFTSSGTRVRTGQ